MGKASAKYIWIIYGWSIKSICATRINEIHDDARFYAFIYLLLHNLQTLYTLPRIVRKKKKQVNDDNKNVFADKAMEVNLIILNKIYAFRLCVFTVSFSWRLMVATVFFCIASAIKLINQTNVCQNVLVYQAVENSFWRMFTVKMMFLFSGEAGLDVHNARVSFHFNFNHDLVYIIVMCTSCRSDA